jgi:hypothetical protein
MLTLLSGVAHSSALRLAEARIFYIADTNCSDSQRAVATGHSHHNRKTPHRDFSLHL